MLQQTAAKRGRRPSPKSPHRKQICNVGPEQGEDQNQNHPSTATV